MTTPDDQAIRDQTVALMQAYQTLITEQRLDEWIELWADDGVCEFPFAAEGRPSRLCGKDEILEYMTQYPGRISIEGVDELRVHLGLDPHVAVVEMTIRGLATETGKPYNQQFVIIGETKDGKLAHYREYWNPLISAEAFG
jgi:uncharacterized protein